IEARYNKDFKISREQLEYLISRTEILKDTAERLCKEKIAEYSKLV
ncbi:MAG: DNA-binding protein, partial [Clostridium sp.]|nr:DNA-binding protein [Clostridium sp.]